MKAYIRNLLLVLVPAVSLAQVPVDDDGNVVGKYESQADITSLSDEGIPALSQDELQELVGPVALYPDELLAIVLPASAYPLQIVEAARFLEALESDATLKPNPEWDDSVVALINYPEVVELLNEDLDWTLRLGEAVVAQQTDVVAAVEAFRDRAYAAGNLQSDEHQTVSQENDVISIAPVAEDVIYVPYYEPAQVVRYSPRPVYYYYPRTYPVYYYPYAADYDFANGYFWGVTTAFTIGWITDSLQIYHHSYYGHPYYGRSYYDRWWYRRPSINVYNTYYRNNNHGYRNHYNDGDRWHARNTRREYIRREGYSRSERRHEQRVVSNQRVINKERRHEPISFREREARPTTQARRTTQRTRSSQRTRASFTGNTRRQEPIAFRSRDTRRAQQQSTLVARRQEPVVRSGGNRRPQPVARSGGNRRQQAIVRSGGNRRQETVVRSRNTSRVTPAPRAQQRAPARTERAPVRQERRHSEPRRQQQATRHSEPRQQSSNKSSGSSEKLRSSSGESHSRSRNHRR